jgi:flagellar protein FlaF
MSSQTPYSKAAGAYVTIATATDQRTMEATVLLQAAQKLEDLAGRIQAGEKIKLEEIGNTLTHNRKLWELFVSDINNPDHHLPLELRNNVASLALFIFKRTTEILIDTQAEKFKALVNINRSIAAGLMKKPAGAAAPAPQNQPAERVATDSVA